MALSPDLLLILWRGEGAELTSFNEYQVGSKVNDLPSVKTQISFRKNNENGPKSEKVKTATAQQWIVPKLQEVEQAQHFT